MGFSRLFRAWKSSPCDPVEPGPIAQPKEYQPGGRKWAPELLELITVFLVLPAALLRPEPRKRGPAIWNPPNVPASFTRQGIL
jgi:hypothetical protein